ncbi:uncharacterized protein LOC111862151 [Cryptotermes secundus]|uniref:uncharacterized protein LOC111862151 n=1 Tax=Cryptotermes secundus TaxID=105785 RepID=UPI000CD7DB6E|nr:uncharacterized protein LOC111862151 [Cryptotermes secundus]
MLEEAVKKIVGKSSHRIVKSARQSNYSIENSLSPDNPVPDKMFEQKHSESSDQRILHTWHKKRRGKSVIEFPGSCTEPEVSNAKKIPDKRKISSENLGMEYMEYAVTVTSYWDEEFMQKFSTKNYLLEIQCQLQDIYCKRKLFASLGRERLLEMNMEAPLVQLDKPLSAERTQTSWLPAVSDSSSLTFSPPIPLPTPILDPLQYLRKVFPKVEAENPHQLRKENIPPAKHLDVGPRQQAHDNFQQHGQDRRTSASLELHSTLPLLPEHTLKHGTIDPSASDEMYRVVSLYVPCKFSLSMDTADVNFKYYPHTF